MTGIMGIHNRPMKTDEWLTPPEIIKALGPFDLDPCAPIDRPWDTASHHFTIIENGLWQPWLGRCWVNPPYGKETSKWLGKLAEHGNGIALIFARTDTKLFFNYVWEKADSLLFIEGRIHFYHIDGKKALKNSGGPSVLAAYGRNNTAALLLSNIKGKFIKL
jgi:hypothetical protein